MKRNSTKPAAAVKASRSAAKKRPRFTRETLEYAAREEAWDNPRLALYAPREVQTQLPDDYEHIEDDFC